MKHLAISLSALVLLACGSSVDGGLVVDLSTGGTAATDGRFSTGGTSDAIQGVGGSSNATGGQRTATTGGSTPTDSCLCAWYESKPTAGANLIGPCGSDYDMYEEPSIGVPGSLFICAPHQDAG